MTGQTSATVPSALHEMVYTRNRFIICVMERQSGEDEWQIDCSSMVVVPSIRCPREHTFVALDRIADGVVDCPKSYEEFLPVCLISLDCKVWICF